MHLIYYTILIFVILYFILITYIKIAYNFWSIQPVFHYYNLFYWIKSADIIGRNLPSINKYCNLKNISTYDYDSLTNVNKQYIINFIKTHYLRSKIANYLPTLISFSSYFENNKYPSYISIYSNNTLLNDYTNKISIPHNEIVSVITGRPLNVSINKIDFYLYYIDYLCVHKKYRKQNIAPSTIQTHELFQRHNNKKIQVCLFKREGEITGIVPLTIYDTIFYKKISVYRIKNPKMCVFLITIQNIYLAMEFIKLNINKFECVINPCESNIMHLIKNNILFIYALKLNDDIISLYFFKNTYTYYNTKPSIELISSISCCPYDEMFYIGFTNAYFQLSKQLKIKIILIENISHNTTIIKNIHNEIIATSPTAFFFYNYATPSISPEKVFIIY